LPKTLLLCLQQASTGPCPKARESRVDPPTLLLSVTR